MRRLKLVPGPLFAWAGDSRWRQAAAWLVRSAIVVAVSLVVFIVMLYVIAPAVIG